MPQPKFTMPEQIWAGTDHSLTLATEAYNAIMAGVYGQGGNDEAERSYLLSVSGDVGIISIKGGMTNRDSYYNRYAGVVSYAEIRRAVIEAAQDESIKAILLDIDSGGGAVSGLADVATLVANVDKSVKSVYAFTDGTMASAAYWLGSTARKVYSSETSMVGSIGVIATHMEYSKAMKEAGIGVTVMRAGEYKALVNPYEALTETAQRHYQGQLNQAYSVFISHVAEQRGLSVEAADKKMGQGREFFGQQALDAGLVDGIKSFDKVVSLIQGKVLDTQSVSFNNSDNFKRNQSVTKRALTEQDIAALAAGAPAAQAGAAGAPVDAAAEQAAADEAAAAAAAATAAPAATAPVAAPQASLVDYLQAQVSDKTSENVKLQIALADAQAQVAAMTESHSALVAIAGQSLRNMKVALGFAATDMSGMSTKSLLAEHSASTEAFTKAFKAGGVAATPEAQTETVKVKAPNAVLAARQAATQSHTK